MQEILAAYPGPARSIVVYCSCSFLVDFPLPLALVLVTVTCIAEHQFGASLTGAYFGGSSHSISQMQKARDTTGVVVSRSVIAERWGEAIQLGNTIT